MIKWMVMMSFSENNENRFAHRAGGVEDLEHALLAVNLNLLPVGVLDGGVVLLHEDALHKLHCQGGLPHTTRTQHKSPKHIKENAKSMLYHNISNCFNGS